MGKSSTKKAPKPKVFTSQEIKRKAKERVCDRKYRVTQADKRFSICVRLFYTNSEGMLQCYTCDKRIHWKDAHNCHREERACLATRWMRENCRPGCAGCNTYNQERHKRIMTIKLIKEYGIERLEEMHALKYQINKMSVIEIKEIALRWKSEAYEIAQAKNIKL